MAFQEVKKCPNPGYAKCRGCIQVYHPIAGWKWMMLSPDPECGGQCTPWTTADCAFVEKDDAVYDARCAARDKALWFVNDGKPGENDTILMDQKLKKLWPGVQIVDLNPDRN